MMQIVFALILAAACGFIAADSYRAIHLMDKNTRHTVRISYVLICTGAMVLLASMLPPLRAYLLGGAALLSAGVAGLVLFNKRRVFERSPANELYVVGDDDMTRTIRTIEKKAPMASRSIA